MLLSGCGPSPLVAEIPPRTLPICLPWGEQALPHDGGEVVQCDERHLTVRFPPSSAGARASDWRLAIRSEGWEEEVDSSAEGLINVRYLRASERLDLSIIDDTSQTLVILTQLTAQDPP